MKAPSTSTRRHDPTTARIAPSVTHGEDVRNARSGAQVPTPAMNTTAATAAETTVTAAVQPTSARVARPARGRNR